TVTTTYIVLVTDAKGCQESDTVVVTVNPLPIVDAGQDVEICHDSSTVLGGSPTATSGTGSYTYSWSPSIGLSSTSVANPVANPTVTTTYIVLVTDAKGCQESDTVVVTVNPLPVVDAGADVEIWHDCSPVLGAGPTASR